MRTTSIDTTHITSRSAHDDQSSTLINLAEHRKGAEERFPDVEELLERLTDDTVSVANGAYRAR